MRNIRHSIVIASATNGKMNTTKTTNQKLKVTSEEMFLLQQALMVKEGHTSVWQNAQTLMEMQRQSRDTTKWQPNTALC